MRLLPLTALCLVLATAPSSAATYYVDPSVPSASTSGPGTEAQPYSTIASAVAARAGPGSTILVKPGLYREQVTIPVSGAAGEPFVLRATGPGVIIEGAEDFSSTSLWAPNFGDVYLATSVNWNPDQLIVDGVRLEPSNKPISSMPEQSYQYITGQGLYVNLGSAHPGLQETMVGKRNSAFVLAGKSWVVIDGFQAQRQDERAYHLSLGTSDVEIVSNTICKAGKYGIYLNDCRRVRIARNTVSDNAGHGIILTVGTSECIIEDNESFGNDMPTTRVANGLYMFGASQCVIRRNRWHDNQDSGQHLQTGANDNVSYNNISWNNGDHGFDHLAATGTLHLNDLAYGNYKDGFSIEGGATGTRLFNCIAVDNGLATESSDLWVEFTSLAGFESDDNIFWNSTAHAPIRYNTGVYSSMAEYSAASGQDTRSQQSDPLFVSPTTGNFHLLAGSPAIDRANASHALFQLTDIDGYLRVDDPATANAGFGVLDHADLGPLEFQPSGLPPVAVLVADPLSGSAPITVHLDASGSSDPDGFIVEYYFDFGDGVSAGPQFGPVAAHTYTAGIHRAVATVTDDRGLTHSDTITVVASRAPVAVLTVSPLSGRAPLTVSLNASASAGGLGPVVSYRFDLGDGTVLGPQASPTASHVFMTGSWPVRLTVANAQGATDSLAAPIVIHVGTANAAPTAALSVTPAAGMAPLQVTADASGSRDADGGIVSFRFTFDDTLVVGPQSGTTANHVLAAGTHIVRVLVSDADGGTASAVATVVVTASASNLPPVAVLAATPLTGNAPLLMSVDGSASSDPEGGSLSYRFDFGDGTIVGPQTSPIASHGYAPGTWSARLTVTDSLGAESQATAAVIVAAPGPGANLVTNPSFEAAMTGWAALSGSLATRVVGGFDGNWAVQITGPAVGTASFGLNDSPNWVVNSGVSGTRFRFSAWVRAVTATGMARLQIREYLGAVKVGATTNSVSVPLSPVWRLVVVEHVSQAAGTTLDFQILDTPAVAGETFLADNIAIHIVPAAEPSQLAPAAGLLEPVPSPALEFGARMVPSITRAEATLHFTTTRRGSVRVELFDVTGRHVKRLLDEPDMAPGLHSLNFDAHGDHGDRLGSGVYFYRVQAAERSAGGRLVLVR